MADDRASADDQPAHKCRYVRLLDYLPVRTRLLFGERVRANPTQSLITWFRRFPFRSFGVNQNPSFDIYSNRIDFGVGLLTPGDGASP